MLIVDAHLDLAANAMRGQEVLRPAREQAEVSFGRRSVGLPDLRSGGVELICATVFCWPALPDKQGYRTGDEAASMARDQLRWYQAQQEAGELAIVTRAAELDALASGDAEGGAAERPGARPKAILLMEGADPLRSWEEVAEWHAAGLRLVGLAWRRTRHAGGTGAPGPLTPEGIALAKALDEVRMIHDLSHLAEESFWQLLDLSDGPVAATHSNCRAIVPTDRQLSDGMIRTILDRGGVIGMNLYDRFLLAPEEHGRRRATLADVVRHVDHVAQLAGHARQIGLGTDMDGGFGREQIPVEIETSADLPRLADALSAAGYGDADIHGIMGGNWLRFFKRALPV